MERLEGAGAGDVNNHGTKRARAAENDDEDGSRTLQPPSTFSPMSIRLSDNPDPQPHATHSLPTPPLDLSHVHHVQEGSGSALAHNDSQRTPTVTLEDLEDMEREYEKVKVSSSADQFDLTVAERLCLETTVPWAWDSARDYCKTFLSSLWDSRLNEGSAVGRCIRAARLWSTGVKELYKLKHPSGFPEDHRSPKLLWVEEGEPLLAMEQLADAILLDPRVINFPNLQDRADFFNQIHWQAYCDTQYVDWPELQDTSADLNNLCGKAEVRAQDSGKGKGPSGVRKGMACYLRNHIVLALLHEQHGRIQDAIDHYGRVIGVLDWIKEAVPPGAKRGLSSISRTSPLVFLAKEEAERARVEAVYGGIFRRGVESRLGLALVRQYPPLATAYPPMRPMLLDALKDTTAEVLRNLTSDIQSIGLLRQKVKGEGEQEQGRYFDEAVYPIAHTFIFQAHYHASIAELIKQSGCSSPRGGRPSCVVSKEKLSWAAYHYAQAGILLPNDEQLRIDCLRNALTHAIKVGGLRVGEVLAMYKAFMKAKKTLRTAWNEIDQLVVNVEEEMKISPISPQAKAKKEKKARQKAAKLAAAADGTGSPASLKSLGSKSGKKKKKRKGVGSTETDPSANPMESDRGRPEAEELIYGDNQGRPSIEVQDVDDDTQTIDLGSPSLSPVSMSMPSPLSPPIRSLVAKLPPSPVEPSFFPSSQPSSSSASLSSSLTLPPPQASTQSRFPAPSKSPFSRPSTVATPSQGTAFSWKVVSIPSAQSASDHVSATSFSMPATTAAASLKGHGLPATRTTTSLAVRRGAVPPIISVSKAEAPSPEDVLSKDRPAARIIPFKHLTPSSPVSRLSPSKGVSATSWRRGEPLEKVQPAEMKEETGPCSPTFERRASEKDATKGKLWIPSPEIKTRSISSVMELQNPSIATAVRSLSMPAPSSDPTKTGSLLAPSSSIPHSPQVVSTSASTGPTLSLLGSPSKTSFGSPSPHPKYILNADPEVVDVDKQLCEWFSALQRSLDEKRIINSDVLHAASDFYGRPEIVWVDDYGEDDDYFADDAAESSSTMFGVVPWTSWGMKRVKTVSWEELVGEEKMKYRGSTERDQDVKHTTSSERDSRPIAVAVDPSGAWTPLQRLAKMRLFEIDLNI